MICSVGVVLSCNILFFIYYHILNLYYLFYIQFESPNVAGTVLPTQYNESRLYWTPAPPKLDVAPAKVKDILFPEYQVKVI